MTADPLSPLAPGQPFPTQAARWNAVFEAARRQRQASNTTPRPGSLGWGGVVEAFGLNDTGGDLREFRPVTATAAGGYELPENDTAWQRAPLLTLSEFTATDDVVCVTLEAIPDGEIGRVAVLGAVLCDVNVLDEGHEFAAPVVGDVDRLRSAESGPVRILHIPAGEGSTRRCVVLLGGGGGGTATDMATRYASGLVSGTSNSGNPPQPQNLGRGVKIFNDGFVVFSSPPSLLTGVSEPLYPNGGEVEHAKIKQLWVVHNNQFSFATHGSPQPPAGANPDSYTRPLTGMVTSFGGDTQTSGNAGENYLGLIVQTGGLTPLSGLGVGYLAGVSPPGEPPTRQCGPQRITERLGRTYGYLKVLAHSPSDYQTEAFTTVQYCVQGGGKLYGGMTRNTLPGEGLKIVGGIVYDSDSGTSPISPPPTLPPSPPVVAPPPPTSPLPPPIKVPPALPPGTPGAVPLPATDSPTVGTVGQQLIRARTAAEIWRISGNPIARSPNGTPFRLVPNDAGTALTMEPFTPDESEA